MNRIVLNALAIFLFSSVGFCQSRVITAKEEEKVSVTLSAQDIGLKKISILVPIPEGIQPETAAINFSGPDGTRLKVSYRHIPSKRSVTAELADTAFPVVAKVGPSGDRLRSEIALPYKFSTNSTGQDKACNGLLSRFLYDTYYQPAISRYLGHNATEAEVCYLLFGDAGMSGSSNATSNSVTVLGLIVKDACRPKLSYALRADISLEKVKDADFTAGSTIEFTIKFDDYSGSKGMKLKARTDGKFAPQSGLIAERLMYGNSSKEHIEIVRWAGNKIRSVSSFKYVKVLYYGGMYLGMALPGPELHGGRGTVLATDGSTGYGWCMPLVKRDSYAGGYHN